MLSAATHRLRSRQQRRCYTARARPAGRSRELRAAATTDAAHAEVGLSTLRLFSTDRYREAVAAKKANFSYAEFLSALTGGLGEHAAPELRRFSDSGRADTCHAPQVRPMPLAGQCDALAVLDCGEPVSARDVDEEVAMSPSSAWTPQMARSSSSPGVLSSRRPLGSTSSRSPSASVRPATASAARSARRLPSEFSSAFGDMSCGSLRQRHRNLLDSGAVQSPVSTLQSPISPALSGPSPSLRTEESWTFDSQLRRRLQPSFTNAFGGTFGEDLGADPGDEHFKRSADADEG